MMNTEHEHTALPGDLVEIASALDALGAAERGSARAGVEQRVFERTRGLIAARDVRPLVISKRSGFRVFTAMRMAAAVVLCAGTAAIWMSQIGTHHPTRHSLEDDVDLMLSLKGPDSVGERIDSLFSDTVSLQDSLKKLGDLPDGDPL